jgi:hypothetical protein
MKLNVNDSEADNVEAVYLDGKRVAMCVEADEEEGYVVVRLPPLDPAAKALDDKEKLTIAVGDPIALEDWITKRLEGEVEIILREREGLNDTGLDH